MKAKVDTYLRNRSKAANSSPPNATGCGTRKFEIRFIKATILITRNTRTIRAARAPNRYNRVR